MSRRVRSRHQIPVYLDFCTYTLSRTRLYVYIHTCVTNCIHACVTKSALSASNIGLFRSLYVHIVTNLPSYVYTHMCHELYKNMCHEEYIIGTRYRAIQIFVRTLCHELAYKCLYTHVSRRVYYRRQMSVYLNPCTYTIVTNSPVCVYTHMCHELYTHMCHKECTIGTKYRFT